MNTTTSKIKTTSIIATLIAAIALTANAQDSPQPKYKTGSHQTINGTLLSLPGVNVAQHASYDADGNRILFYGWRTSTSDEPATGGGFWLYDRTNKQLRLLHDNYNKELSWGGSLTSIESAKLSPDGKRISAIRLTYSPDAKSIDYRKPEADLEYRNAIEACRWLVIDLDSGKEHLLKDLTEEKRNHKWRWSPRTYTWLDDGRIAFLSRAARPDGSGSGIIYTIDTSTNEIREAITYEPGTDILSMTRVSNDKILYHTRSAAATAAVIDYTRKTPMEKQNWEAKKQLLETGLTSYLATFTGNKTTTRQLPIPAQYGHQSGDLSPNERYYALAKPIEGRDNYCLTLLDLKTGKWHSLPGETNNPCCWHPNGHQILATLTADEPTDPPGVIIEIPLQNLLSPQKNQTAKR